MTDLEFIDELPARTGKQGKTEERARELKASPGRWARWPSKTGSAGIKKALQAQGDGFEVVTRSVDGAPAIFARYVEPAYAEDEAPPAPESNGNGHAAATTRPKVKCPTCALFINIESGEDSSAALTRHEGTNPICRASNKRNRNVARR